LNGGNPKKDLAVGKWERDRDFLLDYDSERNRRVFAIIVKRAKKYEKDDDYPFD
jgi:hypothetical protein